jgi:hypothetical protein
MLSVIIGGLAILLVLFVFAHISSSLRVDHPNILPLFLLLMSEMSHPFFQYFCGRAEGCAAEEKEEANVHGREQNVSWAN